MWYDNNTFSERRILIMFYKTYKTLEKAYYDPNMDYELEYHARIDAASTRKFEIQIGEAQAFLTSSYEIGILIESIYQKILLLERLMRKMPPIAIKSYTKNCLIDEIMLTNDIEGIYSTRKEITETLEENDEKKRRFQGLVKRYEKIVDTREEIPLNEPVDVRKLYDSLVFHEIKKEDIPDGKLFRKEEVTVQSATHKIKHKGVLPESRIIAYIQECLDILKAPSLPMIVKIAIVHYFIGYIHPFYDGNGRLSRFISSYYISRDLNWLLALRLSYIIKNNQNHYYGAFDICNSRKNRGDITPFVLMFLELMIKAADGLIEKMKNGKEKLDFANQRLKNLSEDKKAKQLLSILLQDNLFGEDGVSVKTLKQHMGVKSETTVRNLLNELEQNYPIYFDKEKNTKMYHIHFEKFVEQLD